MPKDSNNNQEDELEDELSKSKDECAQLEEELDMKIDECKEKVACTECIEDELANASCKIRKFKKWSRAIKRRFNVI